MRPLAPPPGLLTALRHCALGPRLALGALLAYFIAPCLHTLHHRNDHQHVGPEGAGIVWVEEAPHRHARAETTFATVERPAPAHGPGGLAHFGAAVVAPPPAARPAPFVSAETLEPTALLVLLRTTRFLSARPRGPPPVASVA